MKIKKGETLELTISDLAFGGRGLAKIEGFVIFVDQAVPGDRVLARIFKKKKGYAQARVIELIEPSEFRQKAPCRYSGFCGGCRWQFLKYEKQLEYKANHVSESLEHIGLIRNPRVLPALGSKKIFGYRNKMEFSFSDRRWLLPLEMEEDEKPEKNFALGLHVPGTFNKVLDIEACLLQPDIGNIILEEVRAYAKESGIPAYGLKSHTGFWRFLMLRHSVYHDQWMVNLVTSREDRKIVQPLAEMLFEKYPGITSVVNNITDSKAGVAKGEYEICLAGDPMLREKLGEFEFMVSANSFFQTNTTGAELLYGKVEEYAELTGKENILDLYSGTGTIPIWLSSSARQITGLEIAESSVSDAAKNCANNSIDNCRFILGDIRDSLKELEEKPDVIIIDPPRDGMHKDVVKRVLDLAVTRIVYVSCNPATLARDLQMMKEDYEVIEVQPVDLFPHTFHIESVAKLEKRNKTTD